MASLEVRTPYLDPRVVDAMRQEYGLPPDSTLQSDLSPQNVYSEILNTADLKTGENDMLLLGALESNKVDTQTKVETIRRLYEAIFDNDEVDQYDEKRVGRFLKTATNLYKNGVSPDELKQSLHDHITPVLLEDVALESSLYRWTGDNTETVLHAYCTFQTIERKYKEPHARIIYRKIAKEMVAARELDMMLEKAGEVASSEGRGTAIYLGVRGAEMAQTVAKHAFRNTCQENQAQGVFAPYYRDHVLTANLGEPSEDPQEDLLTPAEAVANLCRVEGGSRTTGKELNVPIKINKSGVISIFTPQLPMWEEISLQPQASPIRSV